MSEFPKVCKCSSTQAISPQCLIMYSHQIWYTGWYISLHSFIKNINPRPFLSAVGVTAIVEDSWFVSLHSSRSKVIRYWVTTEEVDWTRADEFRLQATKKSRLPSMASRSRKAKKQARQTKKKKGDSNCEICVVCDKEINDDTEDSIFCEGECQGWIHRVCAGMSQKIFQTLDNPDTPFLCHLS